MFEFDCRALKVPNFSGSFDFGFMANSKSGVGTGWNFP